MASIRESSTTIQMENVGGTSTMEYDAPEAGMSIGRFLKKIDRNNLLPPNILERLKHGVEKRLHEDCLGFADSLVDAGHLTEWQVERILGGKGGFNLGRYKLVDCIASGGMGIVLKAWQPNQKRMVAIKVLSRTLLKKEEALRRFQQEIQAASALNHHHIVRALDADFVEGIPYLVMEYVEGKTLSEIVNARGPLPIEWACEFCRQAADGLEHARERDVIHRDIKPSNLLLTRRSPQTPMIVKILDFGLARFTSETPTTSQATGLTALNQVFGTVDFIAPEQARSAKSADIRADIFSLGCTLYYLLTGQVPFHGETAMEKLAARIAEDAPLIRNLRPDVSPELEQVIAKMLKRDRQERYQTPKEVSRDLVLLATGTDRRSLSSSSVSIVFRENEHSDLDETATALYQANENRLDQFLSHLDEVRSSESQEHAAYITSPRNKPEPARKQTWKTLVLVAIVTSLLSVLYLIASSGSKTTHEAEKIGQSRSTSGTPWPGKNAAAVFQWKAADGSAAAFAVNGRANIDPATGIMNLYGGSITIPKVEQELLTELQKTNQFSLELVLSTANLQQEGPARILTFSSGKKSRNFTLGQIADRLNLRLRTKYTGENGTNPSVDLCQLRSNREYHLLITYRVGELVCYVDGRQRLKSRNIQGDFRNWEPQHFLVGSEWKTGHEWAGKIERIAVGNRFLTHDEASKRYRLLNSERLK